MSQTLATMLGQLPDLSLEDLWTLQEQLTHQLRAKTTTNGNGNGAHTNGHHTQPISVDPAPTQPRRVEIPGAYRRTKEQVEEMLTAVFTLEELAQRGQTDFSKIYIGPKSASEMLNEDREDRF